MQADAKLVVAGSFTTLGGVARDRIGRLNPDGSLDLAFNPGANDPVTALAVQADANLVVAGGFTTLGGVSRSYIGRLSSDTAAQQHLNVAHSGTALIWARSGAGPEVFRLTLESSPDGMTYTLLGAGTHTNPLIGSPPVGGWQG